MALRLIGAGFGRTGTLSLKAALEALGFNKCYHMKEVFENPPHADHWLAALRGEDAWDAIFDGYQATVDWPACRFYKQLMEKYPDAKVLLSVRDPESWYESALNTIYKISKVPPGQLPLKSEFHVRMKDAIWGETFGGKFEDKQHAIQVFHDHIEDVKRTVPDGRLLVYEVKQGWEPLCQFLERPVPDEPFPRLNDRAGFKNLIEGVISAMKQP